MKKLEEIKQTAEDAKELIRLMDKEIQHLRNLLHRVTDANINTIVEKKELETPDSLGFGIEDISNGNILLGSLDFSVFGLRSPYQKIKELKDKLNQ